MAIDSNINDLKNTELAVRGFTGALPDKELRFYLANGATIAQINDAKKQFIIAAGITFKSLSDSWKEYLVSLGYSGTLNDMEKAFWFDGGPP
jgi:glutamate dehydrogenase/leucine dehydrogenase